MALPRILYPQGTSGIAGVATTIGDFANFAVWHLDQTRENAKLPAVFNDNSNTLFEMYRLVKGEPTKGFGYNVGFWWEKYGQTWAVGHSGGFIGVRSQLYIDPVANVGVVFATNVYPADRKTIIGKALEMLPHFKDQWSKEKIHPDVEKIVQTSISELEADKTQVDLGQQTLKRAPLAKGLADLYAGDYRSCSFGILKIEATEDNEIVMRRGEQLYKMTPVDGEKSRRFQLESMAYRTFSMNREVYQFEVNKAGRSIALWESGPTYRYAREEYAQDCSVKAATE